MIRSHLDNALDEIRSGSGDIAGAVRCAARIISGRPEGRRGAVVLDSGGRYASTMSARFGAVLAADGADHLVVIGADAVLIVELDSDGVVREPFEDVGSIGSARIRLSQVKTTAAELDRESAERAFRILLSAAVIRNADAAYHLARDYVLTREQFGAPLVRIPAVAANLARVHVEVQRLDAALKRALRGDASLGDTIVLSIVTADSASRIARLAHQLNGARGIRQDGVLQEHTRRIWAARDLPRGENQDLKELGRMARLGGEPVVWDALTTAG